MIEGLEVYDRTINRLFFWSNKIVWSRRSIVIYCLSRSGYGSTIKISLQKSLLDRKWNCTNGWTTWHIRQSCFVYFVWKVHLFVDIRLLYLSTQDIYPWCISFHHMFVLFCYFIPLCSQLIFSTIIHHHYPGPIH